MWAVSLKIDLAVWSVWRSAKLKRRADTVWHPPWGTGAMSRPRTIDIEGRSGVSP
jgi:hypothetical protein